MNRYNYQFETSPRKLKPEYDYSKKSKKDIKKQLEINEKQRRHAIKLEKKKHNKNVILIGAVFLILLAISYRSSLINERFNEIQDDKAKLAALQKTNGQLEVNIESNLNLSNIEESAKEKLGMQKLDNSQKVFVSLDKKDYVEAGSDDIDISSEQEELNWFQKIFNKIFGN